jgi:hypothetical protein
MIELWVALLFYGGGVMDDLPLLERRGVRRLFGWVRIPDPTTFGRWLRRSAVGLVPLLDEPIWRLVLARWALVGVPQKLTLVLDSTVSVRYGSQQAGAEKGYNPKKPGRPSHHPLLAFLQETGDCLGVRWRPGSAHAAAGAEDWLRLLVDRLRSAGVEEITVRLDKGFFSRSVVDTLFELDVHFLLKIPNHGWLRDHQRPWRRSERGEGIFPGAETWTATGSLWGGRLLSLQARRPLPAEETLELDTYETAESTHVLTNLEGVHAISAWRLYNQGAIIEQRIEELGQLSAGQTAVDHLEGNALVPQRCGLPTPALPPIHRPAGPLADRPTQTAPSLAAPHAGQAHHPCPEELCAAPSRGSGSAALFEGTTTTAGRTATAPDSLKSSALNVTTRETREATGVRPLQILAGPLSQF